LPKTTTLQGGGLITLKFSASRTVFFSQALVESRGKGSNLLSLFAPIVLDVVSHPSAYPHALLQSSAALVIPFLFVQHNLFQHAATLCDVGSLKADVYFPQIL